MRLTPILGGLLVAAALTPIHSADAVTTDCTADLDNDGAIYLTDSTPALWDIGYDGEIGDGELLDSAGDTDRSDAYDSFPYFAIDDGTNGRENYFNPDGTCTYEADGRQVAFPPMTTTAGLELSRKVYVPASGPGFARFYNQVHNPGTSPVTVTLFTSNGEWSNLGSDSYTVLEDTSAGPDVS